MPADRNNRKTANPSTVADTPIIDLEEENRKKNAREFVAPMDEPPAPPPKKKSPPTKAADKKPPRKSSTIDEMLAVLEDFSESDLMHNNSAFFDVMSLFLDLYIIALKLAQLQQSKTNTKNAAPETQSSSQPDIEITTDDTLSDPKPDDTSHTTSSQDDTPPNIKAQQAIKAEQQRLVQKHGQAAKEVVEPDIELSAETQHKPSR